jgi:hypothetical protein
MYSSTRKLHQILLFPSRQASIRRLHLQSYYCVPAEPVPLSVMLANAAEKSMRLYERISCQLAEYRNVESQPEQPGMEEASSCAFATPLQAEDSAVASSPSLRLSAGAHLTD